MKVSTKILGVDPGTNVCGYGVISIESNKPGLICAGVIQLDHIKGHSERLNVIFEKIRKLIRQYKPDEFAIEAPFFGVNPQSMLKLGRAQGAAMLASASESIKVIEYSPKKVKQSVTGNGNASKEQVAAMLYQILKIDRSPKFLDATDALAVALCHFYNRNSTGSTAKQYKDWSAFVKANPKKVK